MERAASVPPYRCGQQPEFVGSRPRKFVASPVAEAYGDLRERPRRAAKRERDRPRVAHRAATEDASVDFERRSGGACWDTRDNSAAERLTVCGLLQRPRCWLDCAAPVAGTRKARDLRGD